MILSALKCIAVPRLLHRHESGRYLCREFVEGLVLQCIHEHDRYRDSRTRADLVARLMKMAHILFDAVHDSPHGPYVIRDFKPRNIVIPDDDARLLCLIDTGSLRPENDMLPKTKAPHRLGSGKWLFWAPEQLLEDRESLDRHADYFSLGSTAYYILTGHAPYTNTEHNPLEVRHRYRLEYADSCRHLDNIASNTDLDVGLVHAIKCCLHPQPECRTNVFAD